MTNEWQPIETAPRDGQYFLACCAEGSVVMFAYKEATFNYGGVKYDRWECMCENSLYGDSFFSEFTHWMPLPEPPRAK